MGNDGKAGRGGFTLLELIVVLVLVSLMTALVAPRLAGTLASTSARTSVKRIATALRYARNHAASEKAVYVTAFHLESSRVAVGKLPDAAGEAPISEDGNLLLIDPRAFSLADGVRIESVVRASGEAEENESAEIFFYPDGASSGGRVLVVDEKGRRAALSIDGIMGTVRLEE
ncbi:GspH/FimT family pseudopilin [Desulfococcus sp.]|uniref:GspH/FimT family pseudopilin n=1 Tax=Desulfococcus sp. TaxID=2025834 RepID=UPI0035938E76